MKYQIDESNDKYIKISVSGAVDKVGLFKAISDLLKHPYFPHKHSLYDFKGVTSKISVGSLKDIIGILSLYKTTIKSFANKCAIVVSGQTHKAMVDHFIQISQSLPFKYAAFVSTEEAVTFLESE